MRARGDGHAPPAAGGDDGAGEQQAAPLGQRGVGSHGGVDNPLRNLWVTETALTTALHSSYFAESVATFAIVMGFALMITGGGFLVLTLRVMRVFDKENDTEPAVARSEAVLSS